MSHSLMIFAIALLLQRTQSLDMNSDQNIHVKKVWKLFEYVVAVHTKVLAEEHPS